MIRKMDESLASQPRENICKGYEKKVDILIFL